MRVILCLADDLTGGASLAAGTGALGDPAAIGFVPGSAGVVDLGMRDLPRDQIRERIAGALSRSPAGDKVVAFRIDSGGLSPVSDYLEAALDILGRRARAFVMPVHPGARRVYEDGALLVGGVRRALEIRVRGAAPEVIRLADVRSPDLIDRLPSAPVVLFEGVTPGDVMHAAAAVNEIPGPVVIADPGPLTLALRRLGLPAVRLLAIVGSISELTRTQVRASQEMLGLETVHLDVNRALEDSAVSTAAADAAAELLRTHPFVAVVTFPPDDAATAVEGHEVSRMLGEVAAAVVNSGVVDALYLSGGHVAKAVCEALGAGGLTGVREMDTLTAYGRLEGGIAAGMPVALKGGGIGDRATMVRLLERLDWLGAAVARNG